MGRPCRKLDMIRNNFEYRFLFDGRSLDGWRMAGLGRFVLVKQDKSLRSEGGMGLLWYYRKKYKNFVPYVDWKTQSKNDNSGIFVRFADPGDDPWIAVNTGYEIQIDDLGKPDGNPLHLSGSIYKFAGSTKLASKLVGDWNTFEIKVIDQKYSVTLNSEKVIPEFIGNRLTEGFIGIQNHDIGSNVSFKNIKIAEL